MLLRQLAQLIADYRHVEADIAFPRMCNSMDEREVAAAKYPLNLRGNVPLAKQWSAFASLYNVTDSRYAESASLNSGNDVYAAGLPRTFYLGIEYKN